MMKTSPAVVAALSRPGIASAAAALVVVAVTASGALVLRIPSVRIPMSGDPDYALEAAWRRSRPLVVEPPGAPDGRNAFYYRPLPSSVQVEVPLRPDGPGEVGLTLRTATNIRTRVDAFVGAERVATAVLLPGGQWTPTRLGLPAAAFQGGDVRVLLGVRHEPLTRGHHLEQPQLLVDYFEIDGAPALRAGPKAVATLAVLPLAVALFLFGVGAGPAALPAALAAAAAGLLLAMRFPLPVLAAIPRLVLPALVLGAAVAWLLRRFSEAGPRDRAGLAALVAAGSILHGSLAFFPEHCPEDRDTHVVRARDLSEIEMSYRGLLRYGSHLMTPNQAWPDAVTHFGSDALYPYAPTVYFAYHALHRLGLDLIWAFTVFNTFVVMAVAPWLWLVGLRVWGRRAAWLAALLYTADLALWHQVGRARGPAVFGAAAMAVALGYLVVWSDRGDRKGMYVAAGLLGFAALAYTGAAFLLGLFGLALVLLATLDARALRAEARRGLVIALVGGGLVAGALYYGHYVPGLLGSAARGAELPETFPGRTVYAVFRNESRMMMRVWAQGYAGVLLAGLAAAPFALRHARPTARPVLLAWLVAWLLAVVLKDPLFFPRLLRYAKEDLLLAPLLCLFFGGAIAALPRPSVRAAVTAVALLAAAWMQLGDFIQHAVTLR